VAKNVKKTTRKKQARKEPKKDSARRRSARRRGKRTLHYILIFSLLAAAGIALSMTVFFNIAQIQVVGSERYDPVELVQASGVKVEDNLLRVSAKAVQAALLPSYPYLDTVTLRRVFPDTLEIHVTQSKPVGAIVDGDEHVLITREGKVLERGIVFLGADTLLIRGVDTAAKQPGEYLGEWTPETRAAGETAEELAARRARNAALEAQAETAQEALLMIDRLLTAMQETGFSHLTNIDLTDRTNMTAMYENRLLLMLGSEADLAYKLDWITEVVFNQLPAHAQGTIHAEDVVRNPVQGRYTPAPGFDSYGNPLEGWTAPVESVPADDAADSGDGVDTAGSESGE
jgi:Cell division septal protein